MWITFLKFTKFTNFIVIKTLYNIFFQNATKILKNKKKFLENLISLRKNKKIEKIH